MHAHPSVSEPPRSPSSVRARRPAQGGLAIVLATFAGLASAQGEGLVQRETEGPAALRNATEAAIVRDTAPVAPLRLGDLFLFGHFGADSGPASGLRLSSGLFGPQRPFTLFDSQVDALPTQPYLGLGYSRAWPKSQLSVSADLGMTSPANNNGARLRGLLGGAQGLDDATRDLHWSPVMAVNVKYAF